MNVRAHYSDRASVQCCNVDSIDDARIMAEPLGTLERLEIEAKASPAPVRSGGMTMAEARAHTDRFYAANAVEYIARCREVRK